MSRNPDEIGYSGIQNFVTVRCLVDSRLGSRLDFCTRTVGSAMGPHASLYSILDSTGC